MARFTTQDLEITDEERELARQQAEAGGDAGVGSAIGTVAGGALGALGFLAGPLGMTTVPLGMTLGSKVGELIGGGIGEDRANKAADKLSELDKKRQRKLAAYTLRQQALDALLGAR